MTRSVNCSDLKGSYASNTDWDDKKLKGSPDSNLFSRTECWEVAYMIEKVMEEKSWTSDRKVHDLEDLIEDMPKKLTAQDECYEWLLDNA